jgi:hypothetical protein
MADTSSNPSDPRPCETCSFIREELWANTGRGESLYPELGRLVGLDLDNRNDLHECPDCGALFEWADLSQLSGSGNNDEERLTRLNPEQQATARALLDPDPGERDGEQLLERAHRVLSDDILYSILRYRARHRKEAFAGLVRPIVARLIAGNTGSLVDVIRAYCDYDEGRLTEIIRMLDAAGPGISMSAQYLRQACADRVAEVIRYRPK